MANLTKAGSAKNRSSAPSSRSKGDVDRGVVPQWRLQRHHVLQMVAEFGAMEVIDAVPTVAADMSQRATLIHDLGATLLLAFAFDRV